MISPGHGGRAGCTLLDYGPQFLPASRAAFTKQNGFSLLAARRHLEISRELDHLVHRARPLLYFKRATMIEHAYKSHNHCNQESCWKDEPRIRRLGTPPIKASPRPTFELMTRRSREYYACDKPPGHNLVARIGIATNRYISVSRSSQTFWSLFRDPSNRTGLANHGWLAGNRDSVVRHRSGNPRSET